MPLRTWEGAIPIGAVVAGGIGAVGSIGGALINSGASQAASQEQLQASEMALQQQQQMFNTAKHALHPYVQAGDAATTSLGNLLGTGSGGSAGMQSTLENLPGFQFTSKWGNLAATNQLAAQGLGGSGGPLGKALSDYNQGLASTYYNNYASQLQGMASMGSGAAGALAGDAISSGNSQASSITSGGNALASGTLGSANALSGGLSSLGGTAMNSLLLGSLMKGSGGIYSGALGNTSLPNNSNGQLLGFNV